MVLAQIRHAVAVRTSDANALVLGFDDLDLRVADLLFQDDFETGDWTAGDAPEAAVPILTIGNVQGDWIALGEMGESITARLEKA